jgi:hypothetical protein
MTYIAADDLADGVAKVLYESKDGKATKTFDALDWLAQLVTHIPNKGEQMVRYYGFYSNKSRGLRWEVKQRPPPLANAPPLNIHIDYTDSQIPSYEDDLYCDPDYPIEMYAS